MAWVVIAASGAAVLVAGVVATVTIISSVNPRPGDVPGRFWQWLAAAAALTVASLGLRAFRWVFLMRRASVRIPIRDALIGYFAGFGLIVVPLLVGEVAARAFVLRARAGVPVATTVVVNLWERMLDGVAVAMLTVAVFVVSGETDLRLYVLAAAAAVVLFESIRIVALAPAVALGNMAVNAAPKGEPRIRVADVEQLATHHAWLLALAASVGAWVLPAIALKGLVGAWGHPFDLLDATRAYTTATLVGARDFAPAGVLVVGNHLLGTLNAAGLDPVENATTVFAIRMSTVGVTTALGAIFLFLHLRSKTATSASHFDDIAHAYDAQIPEARRQGLVIRKTDLMHRVLSASGRAVRGLDVGCGQGWYVDRMRALGYQVDGIDPSAGQLRAARQLLIDERAVYPGSALRIPADAHAFDFVYTINVLHHLGSVEEQRAAFAEIERVLRPGGLIFVHEINTRNPVFRFYMGYLFPALNCIDEGNERWLLATSLSEYTNATLITVEYFTFLPDFLPAPLVRLLQPIEHALERSPLRAYSAHYMAVLQRPPIPDPQSSIPDPRRGLGVGDRGSAEA